MSLPSGWAEKESRSRPGVKYYVNKYTNETTWDFPTEPAGPMLEQVQALHILKKHAGSRRPVNWKNKMISQSKEESVQQILAIIDHLHHELEKNGPQAMESLFRQIALEESDCSSAKNGGDLGMFGRGQMQKPFEDAAFALAVGGISGIVDTDSGIHVILRIR